MSKAEVYIDDTMNISVGEMRSKLRKLKMERKALDFDWLLIYPVNAGKKRSKQDNRQLEVAEISQWTPKRAMTLRLAVLALSQLSRLDNSKEAPSLSHLRESGIGALEQDADVVLLLHKSKSEDQTNDNEPVDG